MKRADYLHDMRESSTLVARRIKDTIERQISDLHLQEDMERELRRAMSLIISKRLNSSLQKPYIYLLCVGILGSEVDERDYDSAAAIELLNIATYQENTAIDSKFRTLSPLQKSRQYICAAMTREWASSLLESSVSSTPYNSPDVTDLVGIVYVMVNTGQILDLNLTVGALALSEDEYVKRYLRRCELLSGVFNSKIAAIAALTHGKDDNPDLEAGLKAFGVGLQITNDFGDNIVFTTNGFVKRAYQSPFSDLRNGRITYPLYIFLRENETHRKFIGTDWKTQDEGLLADFGKSFIQSSAMDKTRQLVGGFYRKAISHFRRLERSTSRDNLMALTSVLLWNKYYTEVRLRRRFR